MNKKKDTDIDAQQDTGEDTENLTPKKVEKNEKTNSVMYIGPTLKGEMIKHGCTYHKKPDIDTLNEKYPGIGIFFISLDEIAKKLPELSKDGSELNIRYNMIKKQMNGGNGNEL